MPDEGSTLIADERHICHYCGYNLAKHALGECCPECACPIIPVETVISDLSVQSAVFLRRLRLGCDIFLLSGITVFAGLILSFVGGFISVLPSNSSLRASLSIVLFRPIETVMVIFALFLICHTAGTILLTSRNAAGVAIMKHGDRLMFQILSYLIVPLMILTIFHGAVPFVSSQTSARIILSASLPIQLCCLLLFRDMFQYVIQGHRAVPQSGVSYSFHLCSPVRVRRCAVVSIVLVGLVWMIDNFVLAALATIVSICIYLSALHGVGTLRRAFVRSAINNTSAE